MKFGRILTIAAFFALLLSTAAFAAAPITDAIDLTGMDDALPSAAQDAYGSLSAKDALDVHALLGKLWSYLSGQSSGLAASAFRNGAQILLVSVLSVFCCVLTESRTLSTAGASAVALVCVMNVSSCAEVGREAFQTLTDYSHVLLPCLSTAAAASGAWTSAGAKYAASALVMDMMIAAERHLAAPFLYTYAAAAIAAQLTDQPLLKMVTGIMKHGMKWILIILTSGFTIYLSLTGILTGTVDAAASKAAKTVVSSALPVVGGIMADASGALLSGVQMLRNSIGLIGLLVILAVCVIPYLTLGSHYLVYQISAGITESLGDQRIGNIIRCIGDVYGFLLGMVGSASVMLFVSVISLMKTVGSG